MVDFKVRSGCLLKVIAMQTKRITISFFHCIIFSQCSNLIEGLNVMVCYASMSASDLSSSKLEDGVGQKSSGCGFGNWWKSLDYCTFDFN
jgi:hypothetical protein